MKYAQTPEMAKRLLERGDVIDNSAAIYSFDSNTSDIARNLGVPIIYSQTHSCPDPSFALPLHLA